MGINPGHPVLAVGAVPQGLDAARHCTGADGNQQSAVLANALYPFQVFGRIDAAFDECHIDLGIRIKRSGLGKMHQFDPLGEREKVFAQIEKGQLTAVAGTELVHRHARSVRLCHRSTHQNPV